MSDHLTKEDLLKWPLGIALCCREYTVFLGIRLGTCGICHRHPTIIRTLES